MIPQIGTTSCSSCAYLCGDAPTIKPLDALCGLPQGMISLLREDKRHRALTDSELAGADILRSTSPDKSVPVPPSRPFHVSLFCVKTVPSHGVGGQRQDSQSTLSADEIAYYSTRRAGNISYMTLMRVVAQWLRTELCGLHASILARLESVSIISKLMQKKNIGIIENIDSVSNKLDLI